MTSDHIRKLSVDSLYYLDDQALRNVNKDGKLRDYISSAPDYLAIEDPNIERLVSGFVLLKVAFSEIDYSVANESLFNAVYENGIYEITFANIQLLLSVFYQICDKADIRHKTTTLVFQNPGSPLEKKIKEDMDAYLTIILSECQGVIYDNPGVVLDVLNDDSVSDEHKTAYIESLQRKLYDISLVQNKKLWGKLVEAKRITCSEKNIIEYYNNAQELDEPIISLINSASEKLDFSLLDERYFQEKHELFEEFVKCHEINNEVYDMVVPSFDERYTVFAIAGLPDEKMQILINHKIVQMNKESLLFIRKQYPSLRNYYIEHNIDEYVQMMDASLFSFDELIAALSMNISEKNKLQLLRWTKNPISIIGKGYTVSVQEYILNNNLFAEDLPYFYSNFSSLHPQLQKTILFFASKKVSEIIKNPSAVDKTLKEKLLWSTDLSQDQKVKLLIADVPNLEKEDMPRCLSLVGKEDFLKVFDSHARPRFEDNLLNRQLLQAFIGKGWIHEYYQDGDYLRYRRNPRKNE